MRVEITNIDHITVAGRHRKDLGDLHELARSIKEKGLIQPIAVEDLGGGAYALLAGGRRLEACRLAEISTIPVRVYEPGLSPSERQSIELEENIRRKDLKYQEEVNLKRDIHNLQTQIHGEKLGGDRMDLEHALVSEGHSMRDTADLLGEAVGTTSQDIKLAEAMVQMPELGLDKCKNKAEAMKLLNRVEEVAIRAELSTRMMAATKRKDTKLADLYMVGDFFELVQKVPADVMDIIEVDPPYGIDLPNIKDNIEMSLDTSYTEIPEGEYLKFLERVIEECWRIMNDHSWLIFWFGPEPWFESVYQTISRQGFNTRRMPGLWVKSGVGGQTRQPDIYLGNRYEMFFYAYKGDATININKRGQSNVFEYSVVPSQYKIHDTERPVPLMEDILSTFAYEGARLYVPFCGSGNTLRAGMNLNLSPLGCDVGQEYKDAYVLRLAEEGLI